MKESGQQEAEYSVDFELFCFIKNLLNRNIDLISDRISNFN